MIALPRPEGGPGLDKSYRGMAFRHESPIVSIETGDHEHCYSCSDSMCPDLLDRCLHEGYVAPEEGYEVWFCETCFKLYEEPLELKIRT